MASDLPFVSLSFSLLLSLSLSLSLSFSLHMYLSVSSTFNLLLITRSILHWMDTLEILRPALRPYSSLVFPLYATDGIQPDKQSVVCSACLMYTHARLMLLTR